MPQMAPYNWLILFFYFNLIMYIMMSFIQFMPLIKKNITSKNLNMNFFKLMW